MTCVTYRDGVMAADGYFGSAGGWQYHDAFQKLFRLNNGGVAGFSTSGSHHVDRWLTWYSSEEPADDRFKGDDVFVLVALPSGKVYEYAGCWHTDISSLPFATIGVGWPCARAAMLMGASAVQAVLIASMCCAEVSDKITSMTVEK